MNTRLSLTTAAFAATMIVAPSVAHGASILSRLVAPAAASATTMLSATVAFTDVAKQVAPDTYQIDPRAVQGRRLIFSSADVGKHICIGAWRLGACFGIYIEKDVTADIPSVPVPAPSVPVPVSSP